MKRAERHALTSLIRQHGIQQTYRAAGGGMVRASVDNILATLVALGVDTSGSLIDIARREAARAADRLVEPVVLAWEGRAANALRRVTTAKGATAQVELENGDVIEHDPKEPLKRIPLGYHQLRIRTRRGEASALLLAAPRRCYQTTDTHGWGVFAPLYALRENRAGPIGDIADLTTLMRWVAEMHGDVVGTLPISAAFLRTPFEPSPYAPASRLAWNELYLQLESSGQVDWKLAAEAELIDYRAVAEAKRTQLETNAARFFEQSGENSAEFAKFLAAYPHAKDYAAFRAAGERYGSGWPSWPEPARSGELNNSDYGEAARNYHLYAQFSAHRQLTELANETRRSGVRLYLDMPLGVHPDSYDTWRNREIFVNEAAAGAPPDPFFNKGQNWGFPPLHPERMRERHYRYWRAVLQTQLRYAGVLRLDHVMALHRLYFIPSGCQATEGVYVRYPAEELYGVLALESHRHHATIVGEDLGTVPNKIRDAMAAHGVKRMFVVQFEATDDDKRPLAAVPPGSIASLNTHDMPPFRAFWEGRDAELRKDLGLIDDGGVAAAKATRSRAAAVLSYMFGAPKPLDTRAARDALLDYLARSPADIVLVNLEDLWLETEAQNVPGTAQERPNWRRRLKYTLAELREHPEVRAVLTALERARH